MSYFHTQQNDSALLPASLLSTRQKTKGAMNIEHLVPGKVSVIMVTYNRGAMIEKSINSLLEQTYKNIEIVIVDNGSTDDTSEVLRKYDTPAFHDIVRVFRLEQNKRFTGGANYALDKIRGEWFTILDDDDIAFAHAFETMMEIPLKFDPKIDAITCNCINTSTGQFGGKGVEQDQYLSLRDVVRKCKGEFWGITKTILIQNARFNEDLIGSENTFWYQITERANRYYLHQALRAWDTTHGPSMSHNLNKMTSLARAKIYRPLADEETYWSVLREHTPTKYAIKCLKGFLLMHLTNDDVGRKKYLDKMTGNFRFAKLIGQLTTLIPRKVLKRIVNLSPR